MALRPPSPLAVAALLALAALGASTVASVSANFAASTGFSGKYGATCLSCHTVAPVLYTPAHAVLEGLPESWDAHQRYALTIRVEGGPQAMPSPQPQGGFEIADSGGNFQLQKDTESLLRLVKDEGVTYRPAGTMMREWHVDWVAPGFEARPGNVTFWLSVLAADGNHVVAANTSDGGERFDAVDSLVVTVPPSAAAFAAWNAIPLVAPSAAPTRIADGWSIEGKHLDANATTLAFRLDDQAWEKRDTAVGWTLAFPGLAGQHVLRLHSEGLGRASPDVVVPLNSPGPLPNPFNKGTPLPAAVPVLALLVALSLVRRRNP